MTVTIARPTTSSHAAPGASRWERLHSGLGAIPLAGFWVLHLGEQASAVAGWNAHRSWSALTEAVPLLSGSLSFAIFIALFVHAALGLWRWRARPVELEMSVMRRRAISGRRLQQLSGAAVLLFLLFHTWHFPWRLWTGQIAHSDVYPELCASLSSTALGGVPLMACAYLCGLAAAAFHAAQGLYRAGLAWHVVPLERSAALLRCCVVLGAASFLLGASTVIQLATGSIAPFFPE